MPPILEALPVEVLGNILRQVASPEDLYSTIRASPKAFGSFLCFREAIIIEVLQTHLPAEIFAEYLGLLHVPKYEDFNWVPNQSDLDNLGRSELFAWENSRYIGWTTVFEPFLQAHFTNVRAAKLSGVQPYSAVQAADKDQINYLISMYGTLKRLMIDYQSFVRSILTGNPPPLSNLDPSFRRQEFPHVPKDWPALSEEEAIRLQRGFLRYELCSRLNAIPTWQTNIMQWDDEAYIQGFDNSVSQFLQRWEEEEIMCVWVYVGRQYKVLVREVLDEYRSDIRRLSRNAQHAPNGEVILAPEINTELHTISLFERWTYNMSCLGLPMLQQVLRSTFDDQRRFLKNTTFETTPELEGGLFVLDVSINPVGSEWCSRATFNNLPMTNGANSIFIPIAQKLAHWQRNAHHSLNTLPAVETGLKEIGWVFWEDTRRLQYLGWPAPATFARDRTKNFLRALPNRNNPERFEVEQDYTEKSMYVAKKDVQRELSATYAVDPPTPGAEYFFLDRLRAISDWSSREVSPAFQEICSGMPRSG